MPDSDGVLLDPTPNIVIALRFRSWLELVAHCDIAHLSPNLACALESRDCLILVSRVCELIRVDHWWDGGVRRRNREIATGIQRKHAYHERGVAVTIRVITRSGLAMPE